MSSRLETLQVARLAPQLLADSSSLVEDFLRGQRDQGGGFRDRDGTPDLYYTVFGLDGLMALGAPITTDAAGDSTPADGGFLASFGHGADLDFVHFACLAHCLAATGTRPTGGVRDAMVERLKRHRTADGGFADQPSEPGDDPGLGAGSIYSSFMAVGAYDNLGVAVPEPERLVGFLESTSRDDGAYADGGEAGTPITTVTAAAVTLLRNLGHPVSTRTADWLRAQIHPSGGFLATPGAPMPDLLSTAVALHALAGLQADLEALAEPCLDFVDTLWTNRGAFHGHWADEDIDCEYTFYGLLALGHLSVWVR